MVSNECKLIAQCQKHWCMAVIYMAEKRIQYYDSLNGRGTQVLNILMRYVRNGDPYYTYTLVTHIRYLQDESENKKKEPFNKEGWKLVESSVETTPQQDNGSDCGVFSCMAADYIARNLVGLYEIPRDLIWY